ncbi:MAG TPA: sodium-translocating pyrophosphatase [Patescibacteria group bacterium]|nr:sodium-translocating pyrophosphatase [Patescibacteria group bacterium]
MLIPLIAILSALIGLAFAGWLFWQLSNKKVDDSRAQTIASYIQSGSMTYLMKEYQVLGIFVILLAIIILIVPAMSWKLAIAFVIGSVLSALAGFIGMKVATIANVRTAEGCQQDLTTGLKIAFSSGLVMGLSVVGLGLLGITILYLIFKDPQIIYGFGFGASLVALFARVGGGIFTKAADVGADLVGKVEAGIPEDDPRNPATIADNVGDNVGDVAGMGADLFESYVDSIIAAMVLGVVFLPIFGSEVVVLPLLLAGIGIISAIIGNVVINFLKTKPHTTLNLGIWSSALVMVIASFVVIWQIVGDLSIFWAMLSGLIAGIVIGLVTEYYTSDKNKPTQNVARASQTGSATTIISGLALGMMSTVVPVIAVAIAIYVSHRLAGLYGIAISAVGMLSTLGITLATDSYGPVADNAAGIAQMAGMGSETRERAEALDAVGNTTAAVGKGFAIGSAALTALVLLVSFGQAVKLDVINLINPDTIIGLFIGGVLPFVFAALSMKAVGRAAGQMVEEVRRQFREISGLLAGETEPDYKKCINISTSAALRQMILPGLLAVVVPVIVGLWLGPASLAGLLAGAIVTGFLLAVFMANAGGAWDNAKKYIEADNLGGKGSDAHKAAVVGDTIGDPFKDTAGPALNILIKLMAIVSIIIAPLLF